MSIAANIRNNEHLPETAERATLEQAGNDFLLAPAPSDLVAFHALTKPAQGSTPHLVGTPSKKLGLWNGVHLAEMDGSESLHFERRWRWPLPYRSIEVLAIFFDALIIVSAGVLADAAYRVTTTALASEITIYGGAAAVVAALLTCLLKERGLYKPTALLNWTAQVRAVTIAWIGVFMFLAGSVFALKIGSTFSRVTITSFATVWPDRSPGALAHRP